MVLNSLLSLPGRGDLTALSFGEPGAQLLPFSNPFSSLLFFSSIFSSYQNAESIITFISLQSSYNWYLHLSQFETVFLGYLMLQICFFRYLEILPINLNNFFLGEASGRRRRRRKRNTLWNSDKFDCDGDIFLTSLLKVLKRLDDGNCLARTLCELESMCVPNTAVDRRIPETTSELLSAMKMSSKYRHHTAKLAADDDNENDVDLTGVYNSKSCAALQGMQLYEDAVLIGSSVRNYHNSTICEESYSACPLTKQDIEHYIGLLIDANML